MLLSLYFLQKNRKKSQTPFLGTNLRVEAQERYGKAKKYSLLISLFIKMTYKYFVLLCILFFFVVFKYACENRSFLFAAHLIDLACQDNKSSLWKIEDKGDQRGQKNK